MPLTVELPTAEQLLSGVIARFEHRDDKQAVILRGTAKRGPRGITIASLELVPDNDEVTGTLLRLVSPGELLAQLRTVITPPSIPSQAAQGSRFQRTSGRPPLTDEHLRRFALAYLEETSPGAEPGVLPRLCQRFGRPEGTIRGWVRRAREDGWLGVAVKGRAGCEPGPRLLASVSEEGIQ